jgi:hypothetical protein
MEKITLALIAACISIVVALLSLLGVLINARKTKQANVALELLKRQHKLDDIKKQLYDEQTVLAVDGLKAAMQAIQIVKDEIYFLLNQNEKWQNSARAKTRLETVKNNLVEVYQQQHPYLSQLESEVLHSAKNMVFHAYQHFERDKQLLQLRECRTELNLIQQQLRGFVDDRVWSRMKELGI